MCTLWAGGVVSLVWKVNAREDGLAESRAVTVRLTGTLNGELVATPDTAMEPRYVPGLSPAGFTEIETLPDVVPLDGLTDSQLPPDEVAADAEKPILAEGEVAIVKF